MNWFFAFLALGACNLFVFAVSLYALAHVRSTNKALKQLDWETLANLTGEVGAIKRSLQKTNNRINGMTHADPVAQLADLPKLQNATKPNGMDRVGG